MAQYIRWPNGTVILSGQVDSWTFDGVGNPITSETIGPKQALDVNLAGGNVTVGGVGTIGAPAPVQALQAGFEDPSGNLANAKVSVAGELLVSSATLAQEATLQSVLTDTNTLAAVDFATETTLASILADTDTLAAVDYATETTLNSVLTSVSSINTKTPALGQAAMAASSPVVIASNQSAVPVSAAALPLPTGAATETTLAAMSAKLPATLGQKAMTASLAVVLASDQSAIPVSSVANLAGNSPGSSTVSTVATLTAPANAVGFILMCLDSATANIRYRIGATATNASGQQLQAGRDTGYIPCGANVSICAESGTQPYDIQWVLSS